MKLELLGFERTGVLVGIGLLVSVLVLLPLAGCSKAPPESAEEKAAAEASAPTPPPAPKPLWQQHIEELQPEVEDWARAWSNQDVEAYLSHYSVNFEPPRGLSREAWEDQRRQRLTRPSKITVDLSGFRRVGFKKKRTGGREIELVKVQFHQIYSSDTFQDEVDKEMELELVDLTWRIVTEQSL